MTFYHPALAERTIVEDDRQIARLKDQLDASAQFLDIMANTLDEWAEQSRKGGWSTHQVDTNERRADECRRHAAHLRKVARQ